MHAMLGNSQGLSISDREILLVCLHCKDHSPIRLTPGPKKMLSPNNSAAMLKSRICIGNVIGGPDLLQKEK